MNSLKLIKLKNEVTTWVNVNRNLLLLRKRLKNQIPRKNLKQFYKVWLYSHILTRLKFKDNPATKLSPLTVKISPTLRCNLQCKGCFAGNYPPSEDLSMESIENIIEQISSGDIPSVGIIGGEPLLIDNIFSILDKFRSVGFYFVTNGLLVDEEVVRQLYDLPHVVTIISNEGFENTTDYLRGPGVFQKIIKAMQKMKKGKLVFGFSTTVHKENLEEVISEEYIDFMIEQGCCFGAFLPYIPVGSSPRYEVVCSSEEVATYYNKLDEICNSKPILILKEGFSDGTFLNDGCGAGHTIHITSKGEAEPCNGIEFFTHTTQQSSVEEILKSDFFNDIRKLNAKNGKKCITITQPESILDIVKKYDAKPTHELALEHLQEYINIRQTVRGKIVNA